MAMQKANDSQKLKQKSQSSIFAIRLILYLSQKSRKSYLIVLFKSNTIKAINNPVSIA